VGTPEDSAPEPIARPNRFDVDLGAIAHNVTALRAVIPDGTRICAAVKADAYGFGLLPVARTLTGAGVDLLGLVDLRDAVALRQDGIVCPILLYDGNLPDERLMRQINEHDLTITVGNERSTSAWTSPESPVSSRATRSFSSAARERTRSRRKKSSPDTRRAFLRPASPPRWGRP
jgi:alanine racemase